MYVKLCKMCLSEAAAIELGRGSQELFKEKGGKGTLCPCALVSGCLLTSTTEQQI